MSKAECNISIVLYVYFCVPCLQCHKKSFDALFFWWYPLSNHLFSSFSFAGDCFSISTTIVMVRLITNTSELLFMQLVVGGDETKNRQDMTSASNTTETHCSTLFRQPTFNQITSAHDHYISHTWQCIYTH